MQQRIGFAPMAGTVRYEAVDGVATLTLDRPERLNTITPELIDDFERRAGAAPRTIATSA